MVAAQSFLHRQTSCNFSKRIQTIRFNAFPAWHTDCFPRELMDAVLMVIGLVAAGLVLEVYAAATAPLGYQDESGFYLGSERRQNADLSDLGNPS